MMELDRVAIVAEARKWIGTKFQHQGRVMNVGVDCAGVAICVARDCGLEWGDREGYSRVPSKGLFIAAFSEKTDPVQIEDIQPGDLIFFAWREEPQHVAIVSQLNPTRIIHAWQQARKCVENDLDEVWSNRVICCRRYRSTV